MCECIPLRLLQLLVGFSRSLGSILLSIIDSVAGHLGAEGVDLLGKKQVVELVDAFVLLSHLSHSLFENRVSDEVLLHFGVGLVRIVHAVVLALVKGLSDLSCLMNMRLEAGRLRKLEDVCVESGHLWADVVEQIGLLHMVTLNAHWDLLVQLLLTEAERQNFFLRDVHLDGTVLSSKRLQSNL